MAGPQGSTMIAPGGPARPGHRTDYELHPL